MQTAEEPSGRTAGRVAERRILGLMPKDETLTGAADEPIELIDAEDPEEGVAAFLKARQEALEAGYDEVEPELG